MSRLFWLGLLLNFCGVGFAEDSTIKGSAKDLSKASIPNTEAAPPAESVSLDVSNTERGVKPAFSESSETTGSAAVPSSKAETIKEPEETSISKALESSGENNSGGNSSGQGAAQVAPQDSNEQPLTAVKAEPAAGPSSPADSKKPVNTVAPALESKEKSLLDAEASTPQPAPGAPVNNDAIKEEAKVTGGVENQVDAEGSRIADETTKTKPEANQDANQEANQEANQKASNPSANSQPPASPSVYYSPVSKIDMAKHKPVYGDKGDGKVKFGTWMISLGSGKSNFSKADYYKEFYGSFANTLDFGVDWFFLRHTYAAAGIGGRFSYYTDKGSRQTKTGTKAPGNSTFTVLSKVVTLQGVISPLPWHWIVFKGWAGRQYDSFEESRDNEASTSAAASDSTSEANKLLISPGKRNGTVKGASILFDISFLDSRSIKSMKPTLGIDSLYIAPFKEVYEQKSVKGINLTRNLSGVMLVFGSAI